MRIAALIVLGSLVPGTRASAQAIPVQQHQGLWGGFGVGTGVNLTQLLSDPADGLPSGGGLWGFTGYGRIGGTLSQRVLLGGESAFWIGSRDGVDFSRGNLSAVVLFYPQARGGLFLKAGIGLSYTMTALYQSTTVGGVYFQTNVSQSKGGFGATASVGYDLRLGRNIYLVPEVGYYLQVGDQRHLRHHARYQQHHHLHPGPRVALIRGRNLHRFRPDGGRVYLVR